MLRQLGNELRVAREKRGISIADAQTETKIRSRYLEALEQGQFSILPGGVYAKGFLKSYANYLGLDGPAMVVRFKQWQEEQEAAQAQAIGIAGGPGPAGPARVSRPVVAKALPPARPTASPVAAPGSASPAAAPGSAAPETAAAAIAAPASRPQAKVQPPALPVLKARVSGLSLSRSTWAALAVLLVAGVAVGGWLAWRNGSRVQGSPPTGPGVETPQAPGTQPGTATGDGQGTGQEQSGGVTLRPGTPPDAYTIPFVVGATANEPLKLTVTARDSCWIRLERPGTDTVEEILAAGASRVWEFTGEAHLKLGNPPGASVKVEETALPEATYPYPVTYVFTRP
ncbi:MAG: RodZ domain-containing protein [Symbiobacteriia bacterium]